MTKRLRGDNILLQMFRTTQAVRDLMTGAVSGTGIRSDEYAVLSAIGVLRSVPPTELANRLRVPPTTISRYVAGFIEGGLVARAPNPADGRSYLLELTPAGRQIVRTVAPRIRGLVRRLREVVDVEEIERALRELEGGVRAVDTTAKR